MGVNIVRRIEFSLGVIITLAAVCLHVVFLNCAGGLWRDEVSSLQVATQPTLSELWHRLEFDSFPGLFHLAVRAWTAAGLGGSDLHLRWLGFIIGLAWLASLWCAARLLRGGTPMVSLALLASNAMAIHATDSLRGYGLGSALIILTLALMWRFVQKPTLGRGAGVMLAAALSVQCLYQNAFLLLAICCGASAVCARARQWRAVLWIVGIGAVSAISLLPYLPATARTKEWFILAQSGFDPDRIWRMASGAMGCPAAWFNLVWVLLFLAAFGSAGAAFRPGSVASAPPANRDLTLFAAVAMVVGVAGFVVFLEVASLPTQSWYYIPLLGFVAVCLDAILPACHRWAGLVLTAFAATTTAAAFPQGLSALNCRQTNVDLLAAQLTIDAAPNDFIIVHPFYCATTFYRYYKGNTPWTTLPPLEDYRLQRYDLFKVKMQMERPIQPVLDRVVSVLQSGHRVWLVGWIPLIRTRPPEVRPAPNNRLGWIEDQYSRAWGAQAGYFIVTHAAQAAMVGGNSTNCVRLLENLPMVVINGTQPSPPSTAPP